MTANRDGGRAATGTAMVEYLKRIAEGVDGMAARLAAIEDLLQAGAAQAPAEQTEAAAPAYWHRGAASARQQRKRGVWRQAEARRARGALRVQEQLLDPVPRGHARRSGGMHCRAVRAARLPSRGHGSVRVRAVLRGG